MPQTRTCKLWISNSKRGVAMHCHQERCVFNQARFSTVSHTTFGRQGGRAHNSFSNHLEQKVQGEVLRTRKSRLIPFKGRHHNVDHVLCRLRVRRQGVVVSRLDHKGQSCVSAELRRLLCFMCRASRPGLYEGMESEQVQMTVDMLAKN